MRSLHPFDRPHARRAEALGAVVEALGADAAHHVSVVRGADRIVRYHGVAGPGAEPSEQAHWSAAEGVPLLLGDLDLDHVAPPEGLVPPPEDFYCDPVWRVGFGAIGYRRVLQSSITEGGELRGQVSLLRRAPEPWKPAGGALAEAFGTLRAAFRAAWHEERALAPPPGAVALYADGRHAADDAVAAWLDRTDGASWLRRRAARELAPGLGARDWVPGAFAHWSMVPGDGVLVAFEPVEAMALPPVLRLTPTQRRVASLAAAGATVAEIARALDRSAETVREHLTRIYKRLGLASRSELASACRRMML